MTAPARRSRATGRPSCWIGCRCVASLRPIVDGGSREKEAFFDSDRNAVERAERLASRLAFVGRGCFLEGLLKAGQDDGVQAGIDGFDACDEGLCGFDGRKLALRDAAGNFGGGEVDDFAGGRHAWGNREM